ncbi:Hypothetical protein NGAL_HAMBI2605_42610 [Neorhizobium galegae bv. orientalis]|nr:Hypothetical protein NGAL_HAMBI2605_42610 [Neorhizobium galegae bv. orientalis]
MSKSRSAGELSEQEIIALSETDEWVPVGDTEDRRRVWQDAARRARSKVNGRAARLKAKALEQGMPYQTLINSILHKYVS